jgi:hypothetical protein
MKRSIEMMNQRSRTPHINWAFQQFSIDGPLFERWFLKTLLNMSFNHGLIIGPGDEVPGIPRETFVRIAFGLDEFPNGSGLYIAFQPNETFNHDEHIRYTAKAKDGHLLMGSFRFLGYRFYLNLMPERFTDIEGSNAFYRKANFNTLVGNRVSHSLSITWPASQ